MWFETQLCVVTYAFKFFKVKYPVWNQPTYQSLGNPIPEPIWPLLCCCFFLFASLLFVFFLGFFFFFFFLMENFNSFFPSLGNTSNFHLVVLKKLNLKSLEKKDKERESCNSTMRIDLTVLTSKYKQIEDSISKLILEVSFFLILYALLCTFIQDL